MPTTCSFKKSQRPSLWRILLYSTKHTFMLPRWLCHSAPRITPPGIFSSIKALRTVGSTKPKRKIPSPAQSSDNDNKGQGKYLIYWGNWADPSASMDDYLHKAMPNASESLCFPLQRKNPDVSEETQKMFFQFNFRVTSHFSLLAPH